MAKNKQIDGQLSFEDFMLDDDALFEKEYEQLMKLFESVNNPDFNLLRYLPAIVSGVKTSISEKIGFEEALGYFVSDETAKNIALSFPDEKGKELFDIVGSMHDEIR